MRTASRITTLPVLAGGLLVTLALPLTPHVAAAGSVVMVVASPAALTAGESAVWAAVGGRWVHGVARGRRHRDAGCSGGCVVGVRVSVGVVECGCGEVVEQCRGAGVGGQAVLVRRFRVDRPGGRHGLRGQAGEHGDDRGAGSSDRGGPVGHGDVPGRRDTGVVGAADGGGDDGGDDDGKRVGGRVGQGRGAGERVAGAVVPVDVPVFGNAPTTWNTSGWRLFDNATTWARQLRG